MEAKRAKSQGFFTGSKTAPAFGLLTNDPYQFRYGRFARAFSQLTGGDVTIICATMHYYILALTSNIVIW
jgi:hypothetical protein